MREKIDISIIGKIADKNKKLNSTTSTKIDSNIKTDVTVDTSTSTDTSTKLKPYAKDLQIKKIQRSYYIEKNLLKQFETFCNKHNVDKSKVVNDAIKLFLDTYK